MLNAKRLSTKRGPNALFGRLFAALLIITVPLTATQVGAQDKKQAKQPAAAKQKKAAAPDKNKKPQNAWVKLCDEAQFKKDPKADPEKKKICLTHHERLDGNTGLVLVSAAVRKVDGQDKEQFLVMVPLGMAIPPGIQVQVDKEKPIRLKYSLCHAQGCTAEGPASKELVEQLKKGKELVVAAINVVGKPVGFPVPLSGFGKAYDGKPVDSKKYKDARKKLMLMIRKRQIELAKKAAEERKKKAETTGATPKKEAPKK